MPAGSWVVVDEVQKLPALLNEVQDLLVKHRQRYRFALTGSSARKFKRSDGVALKQLREDKHVRRAFGVYLGRDALRDGPIDVLPLLQFLRHLTAGHVLG